MLKFELTVALHLCTDLWLIYPRSCNCTAVEFLHAYQKKASCFLNLFRLTINIRNDLVWFKLSRKIAGMQTSN